MSSNRLSEIVELVLDQISKLPEPPRDTIRGEFMKIKEMVMDNRPPRILVLGRRGAGKSSMINAIFGEKVAEVGPVIAKTGESVWHAFSNPRGAIHILDTRGVGDSTRPELADHEEALDDIKHGIKENCPDVILFLCKAKEVDAHIDNDISSLFELLKYIREEYQYEAPVAAVLTQVDELDPKRVEPPYEDPEKLRNINGAVTALKSRFAGAGLDLLKIIPVAAYSRYDQHGKIFEREHWNIDSLVDYLVDVMPKSAQVQLARLSSLRKTQRKIARALIASSATVCAGVAATPIPLADIVPITAAQVGMVTGIGYIAGRELDEKSAMEFLAALGVNVSAGFALREGARALAKFVFPGAGYLVSAGVALAGTWGIGEAAIAYFIDNSSVEEAKERFKRVRKEHGAESDN